MDHVRNSAVAFTTKCVVAVLPLRDGGIFIGQDGITKRRRRPVKVVESQSDV